MDVFYCRCRGFVYLPVRRDPEGSLSSLKVEEAKNMYVWELAFALRFLLCFIRLSDMAMGMCIHCFRNLPVCSLNHSTLDPQ
jgi:hypothetical protein